MKVLVETSTSKTISVKIEWAEIEDLLISRLCEKLSISESVYSVCINPVFNGKPTHQVDAVFYAELKNIMEPEKKELDIKD